MALLPQCCRCVRGHQANDAARHTPARSRRGATSSRVSLTHSLARVRVRCWASCFLFGKAREAGAGKRAALPHTAEPSLAAFARPHPLASPAASCLRDADSAASRASRPETTALAGDYPPLHRISRQAFARRRPAAAQEWRAHPIWTARSSSCAAASTSRRRRSKRSAQRLERSSSRSPTCRGWTRQSRCAP